MDGMCMLISSVEENADKQGLAQVVQSTALDKLERK